MRASCPMLAHPPQCFRPLPERRSALSVPSFHPLTSTKSLNFFDGQRGNTATGNCSLNTSTCYFALFYARNENTAESSAQVPVPAGTLSNFKVSISAAQSGPRAYTFTVRKGGVNTTATCTINGSNNGTGQTSATACADTTNSVTFAAGDLISVQVAPSNSPSPSAVLIGWTATFTPS